MNQGKQITLQEMTRNERSLLLYLESRAVDFGGKVDSLKMNAEDHETAEKWASAGFVGYGRFYSKDVKMSCSYWVELSEEAWKLAHEERKARAARGLERREWRKSGE